MGNNFAVFPNTFWEEHFWRTALNQARDHKELEGGDGSDEEQERWLVTQLKRFCAELFNWGLLSKGVKEFCKYMHFSEDMADSSLFSLLRHVDACEARAGAPKTWLSAAKTFALSTVESLSASDGTSGLSAPAEAARSNKKNLTQLKVAAERLEMSHATESSGKGMLKPSTSFSTSRDEESDGGGSKQAGVEKSDSWTVVGPSGGKKGE